MKFSIKYLSSKCDQIRSFQRIWSHLLEKSLMENSIFSAVYRRLSCMLKIMKGETPIKLIQFQCVKKTSEQGISIYQPITVEKVATSTLFFLPP